MLITGSSGFVGKNLAATLALREGVEILRYDLGTLEPLADLAARADFVFHLAGVNRPQDVSEFQTGNAELTKQLCDMLVKTGRRTPLALSSSIQAAMDNPYGASKKAAEDAVFSYARNTGAPVLVYRLCNLFGKWCRPNYNSVVATFCHNAAHGLPLRVDDPDKTLELLHIDDLVAAFLSALDGQTVPGSDGFCRAGPTHGVTLGRLAELIAGFAASRTDLTHRFDRSEPFVRKLYGTFLSYLEPDALCVPADMKTDARGYFTELIKSPLFGQISVSRTKPGVTRGNHWHNAKVEKFIVVEGRAMITFRKIGGSEVVTYPVTGDKIEIVDIPPGYTHAIKNVGEDDVITIFWAGELFDPENPDTVFEEV